MRSVLWGRTCFELPRTVNPTLRARPLAGLLLSVLLSTSASALAPGVITVGPAGSGSNFPEISDAVAAAMAGDRIIVEPGSYARFVVDKPVTVLGRLPGTVFVRSMIGAPAVRISGLAASEEAVVAEISVEPVTATTTASQGFPLIVVRNNLGVAVLQHVTLTTSLSDQPLRESLRVRDTECFYLLDSTVDGYDENAVLGGGFGGGLGIDMERSTAWLLGCTITGGDAALLTGWFAADGGAGIEALDSVLRLARTTVLGGSGGTDFFGASGDGRPALEVTGCELQHRGGPGSQLAGGAGAVGGSGAAAVEALAASDVTMAPDVPSNAGTDGDGSTTAPVFAVDPASTLSYFPTVRPTLGVTPSGVPLGGAYLLESNSQPSTIELHWLALGFGTPITVPGIDGEIVIATVMVFHVPSLFADSSGYASMQFQLPPSPQLAGLRIVHQTIEIPLVGTDQVASNPASVILLP